MQPIVFSDVRISYAEFQKINQQFFLRNRWYVFLIAPIVIAFLSWNNFSQPQSAVSAPFKILIRVAMLVFMWGATIFNFRRTVRRQYEASKLLQTTATYTLTQEGIMVESPIWRATTKWPALQGYRKINGWYYLVASSASGFLLDPRCLQAPATEADVDYLLQSSGVRQL
jgi:hypothetical protein